MQLPKRKSEILRQSKEEAPDRYMTPAAIERLKRTMHELEFVERPMVLKEVTAAVEMGDLSENAGYTESKARLRRIDNRLLTLKERLKFVIPINNEADGTVQIGSTVRVHANGKTSTFLIVGSIETDPMRGHISYKSPIGSLLINHKEGDVVAMKTPNGPLNYEIIEVT